MEQKFHIRYEDKQKEAITAFFKEPFLILTGGPGTGKTTIVKGILDLYQRYYPSDTIALCAPTGRDVYKRQFHSGPYQNRHRWARRES